jgi:hypothetical protein
MTGKCGLGWSELWRDYDDWIQLFALRLWTAPRITRQRHSNCWQPQRTLEFSTNSRDTQGLPPVTASVHHALTHQPTGLF